MTVRMTYGDRTDAIGFINYYLSTVLYTYRYGINLTLDTRSFIIVNSRGYINNSAVFQSGRPQIAEQKMFFWIHHARVDVRRAKTDVRIPFQNPETYLFIFFFFSFYI